MPALARYCRRQRHRRGGAEQATSMSLTAKRERWRRSQVAQGDQLATGRGGDPVTAAMIGRGWSTIKSISRAHSAKVCSKKPRPPSASPRCDVIYLQVMPGGEQAAAAAMTMTRTLSSSRAASSFACNASIIGIDKALAADAQRRRRISPTRSWPISGDRSVLSAATASGTADSLRECDRQDSTPA